MTSAENQELCVDAGQHGFGVVLSDTMEDGSASRTFSVAKRNYAEVEKEGLAIVFNYFTLFYFIYLFIYLFFI